MSEEVKQLRQKGLRSRNVGSSEMMYTERWVQTGLIDFCEENGIFHEAKHMLLAEANTLVPTF